MKSVPAKRSTAKRAAEPVVAEVSVPRRRSATPPPAVNAPLSFITFVATYPVGTTVEGEVVSFTSHGAMVDVALPDGGSLHCYIPLSAMGDPPPTKARQVLTKGEVRPFVLSSLDPPRRVAELSLPEPPVKKRRGTAKKAAGAAR
jgi:ribosomal protein S1